MNTGQLLYDKWISLPAGTWKEFINQGFFKNPTNPVDNVWMRLEIYNSSATFNLDVDHARLAF